MSEAADQVAQRIADVVRNAVRGAKYCQEHIADTAHRATYLAVHQYISALIAKETDQPWDASQIRETARRYDEKRKAEFAEGLRKGIEAALAARKQALGV